MNQERESSFTLSIVTENESSALIRLTMTLARHRMRVESLTSTCGESGEVCRHIVSVVAVPDRVRRAMKQISSCVGVLVADCYDEGETVDREVALFKLDTARIGGEGSLRELARTRRARVVVQGDGYVIVEKTGCAREIMDLYDALQPFGIMEFVRSGRVMVTKAGSAQLGKLQAVSGDRSNGG